MMQSETVVYRDDTKEMVSDQWGPGMKFRLVHYGPVRPDKRGQDIKNHKQQLRRRFHRQLRELWSRHKTLQVEMTMDNFKNAIRPEQVGPMVSKDGNVYIDGDNIFIGARDAPPTYPLVDLVRKQYSANCRSASGYEWAPMVLNSYEVACELDILMLFADSKPGPLEFGDVDNRVKTLIDALRQPDPQNIVGGPQDGEDPFFVLMQDDKLVTKLAVETDQLYRPQSTLRRSHPDDKLIHVTITVTLRPYRMSMFNLMFA